MGMGMEVGANILGVAASGSGLGRAWEWLSLVGQRQHCLVTPRAPLAILPLSQLQVLSGFAGKGTVCMCVLAKATSLLAPDASQSLLGSAGFPEG